MKNTILIGTLLLVVLVFSGVTASMAQDATPAAAAITEAKLGANVENRVLTGEDSTFATNAKVYLWMKITGGSGETLTVTWKHGENTHTTSLTVGGSPWRTWANKTVAAAGDWSVSVTDSKGTTLKELTFKVK